MDTLRTFPAVVQVLGWDEAFMAVETDDPEALAREVQREVLERTGLWCSIGVGDSQHRAKLASAFAKPRGVFRLTREEWPALMGPRPVDALWGIGKKTAAKLERARHPHGRRARERRRRGARRPVRAEHRTVDPRPRHRRRRRRGQRRAVRASRTEPRADVPAGPDRSATRSGGETERIARELVADLPDDRLVMRVTVKLRTSSFFTSTHGRSYPGADHATPRPSSKPRSTRSRGSSSTARFAYSACAPSSPTQARTSKGPRPTMRTHPRAGIPGAPDLPEVPR